MTPQEPLAVPAPAELSSGRVHQSDGRVLGAASIPYLRTQRTLVTSIAT